MKKILLILALALVCSFNANAQLKQLPDGTVVYPATGTNEKKASVSAEPCVTYTAEQALDATTDGNNNTFAAVYSTNTTRNCGGKLGTSEKLIDAKAPANVPVSQGGAGCGVGNPECLKWDM